MKNIFLEDSLWSALKTTDKPIVLYGMGDGADKIIKVCREKDIVIAGIFASDDFVRGHEFRGYKVERFSDIIDRYGDIIILLGFGTTSPEVIEFIEQTSLQQELYIPDLPVAGERYFTERFLEENINEFQHAYSVLADDESKNLFSQIIKYKISGKKEYLLDTVSRREMFEELFNFGNNEVFVDAGAYKGDTIEEFLRLTNGKYNKIYALEPDGKNYKKLKANTQMVNNLVAVEAAAWDKNEMIYFQQKSSRGGSVATGEPNTRGMTIDDLVGQDSISYIKYDVEGAELNALNGSVNTIKNNKPKLLISAYHRPEDLFMLTNWVHNLGLGYKLYLRRNFGYPAWDINLIGI